MSSESPIPPPPLPPRDEWIEHRRAEDRERLGWIVPVDAEAGAFIALDLLGRPITDPTDWFHAESALDSAGIAYLADPYELELPDGSSIRVRLTDVSPSRIRVKEEDFGDIARSTIAIDLPFPAPETLRSLTR